MSLHTFFLVLGAVILIGFMGRLVRSRALIPESLFLIVFGLLIGPVLGLVPGEEFLEYLPIVSVAAMVAILVESGLGFDISKLSGSLRKASLFTFMVAVLTTVLVGGFLHTFMGWGFWEAALLGLISSGTTTITAITLLKSIGIEDEVKRLILLETIINDFTLIIGTFLIVEIIKISEFSIEAAVRMVLSEFAIALLLGAVATMVWRAVLKDLYKKEELSYISTLGACFVLYFLADFLGGNPIIAIFTFSLLFGNYRDLFKFISKIGRSEAKRMDAVMESLRSVQTDITFFLAASFFVLLGITFDADLLQQIPLEIIAAIILIIIGVRFFSSSILSFLDRTFWEYKSIITVMIPRGYVAAILAFVPAQEGIEIPLVTDIVVILIIVTTVIAIGGTALYARFRG